VAAPGVVAGEFSLFKMTRQLATVIAIELPRAFDQLTSAMRPATETRAASISGIDQLSQ
jgi:hypothetical protein